MKQEPIRDEFLEKRKARQRKARKKRAITTFIFLMACLVITAVILCLTVFFPIKNITATGSKIYSNAEIVKQSGISVGDNIFTFGENTLLLRRLGRKNASIFSSLAALQIRTTVLALSYYQIKKGLKAILIWYTR